MIAKAPAWLPVSASTADNTGGPTLIPAAQGEGKGFALTSHSFNLTTKLFSLDFTWRRLEVDGPRQTSGTADRPQPGHAAPKHAQTAPPPSFAEVLKRQQLASLLAETAPPPEHRETIQSGTNSQAQVFSGPAQRAYSQSVPEGPLSGARFYKA